MKPDAVLFDIDGVLVDVRQSYIDSIRKTVDLYLQKILLVPPYSGLRRPGPQGPASVPESRDSGENEHARQMAREIRLAVSREASWFSILSTLWDFLFGWFFIGFFTPAVFYRGSKFDGLLESSFRQTLL
jgi:phosphoglycolate phosphatase-like HAD superfamily hydrolase